MLIYAGQLTDRELTNERRLADKLRIKNILVMCLLVLFSYSPPFFFPGGRGGEMIDGDGPRDDPIS